MVHNIPNCATRIPLSVKAFLRESSNDELLYNAAENSMPSFGSSASIILRIIIAIICAETLTKFKQEVTAQLT